MFPSISRFQKYHNILCFPSKHCYQFPFRQIIKRYALPFLGSVFNHIQFSLYELFNSTVSQPLQKVLRKRPCQLPRCLFWVSMPRDKSTNQISVCLKFPAQSTRSSRHVSREQNSRLNPSTLAHKISR